MPSTGGYYCSFLPHCKLASVLKKILGWDFPFCALSHLFTISGHRRVRSAEGKARGSSTLVEFWLVENVTVQPFRRFNLKHRTACALASALQERVPGAAMGLPLPSAAQCRRPGTDEQRARVHGMHTNCLLSFCQKHHQTISLSPNKSRYGLQSWQEKQAATPFKVKTLPDAVSNKENEHQTDPGWE